MSPTRNLEVTLEVARSSLFCLIDIYIPVFFYLHSQLHYHYTSIPEFLPLSKDIVLDVYDSSAPSLFAQRLA